MEDNIAKNTKIFIAGHNGMVGSAIYRALKKEEFNNIITVSKKELNLLNQDDVKHFFEKNKPHYVILAAAKVGGINANIQNPATFLYENLVIQNNIINYSFESGVKKLVFLGSSCIYPRDCPQPMKEEYLLTGKLEPTNEGYALAKIAGLKLCETYYKQYGFNTISLMPCNLYGPNDSFDLAHSHVLSALVKKFSDAVETQKTTIELWGTGEARREFMHVDDLADATLYLMKNYSSNEFINVGCGDDISIKELAELIALKTGYKGSILWDSSKPNGMLRKCMDVSKMKKIGFSPKISLASGIEQMIEIYKSKNKNI
jgi:GDP-L-fucose synthase